MSASTALLEFFILGGVAFAALGVALLLGISWRREDSPPHVGHYVARNACEAFATLGVVTMIGAMAFVLIPILFVLTPFLMLAAWALFEPPPAHA